MPKPLSPLRYCGGKSRAVPILSQYIPDDCREICSPFFGGGSFELHLAQNREIKVFGYDIFNPLSNFWTCLLEDRERLFRSVQSFFPLPKHQFYHLQKTQDTFTDKFVRAAVFYVLNRASFSGSTLSGGMSPGHPRFNLNAINRIRNFNISNFSVECKDFGESIKINKDKLMYLDPPYLIPSNLYGNKGSTHKGFSHAQLREILFLVDCWFMSYNDCETIRSLYSGFFYTTPTWKYGMSKNKSSSEILIFSDKMRDLLKISSKDIKVLD